MPRRTLELALLLVLSPSCYSPNQQVAAEEGGDASTSSTAGGLATVSGTETTTPAETGTEGGADVETTAATQDVTGGEPVCGDAVVDGDEVCDDGANDGSYGGCLEDCSGLGPHCGDDAVQGSEDCDDGDAVNGDGCNVDCRLSATLVWARTFDDDYTQAIAIGADDDIVVVSEQARILGFDSDGVPEWDEIYSLLGADDTRGGAAAYDPGSGWLVGGRAMTPLDSNNAWWRRLDNSGVFGAGGVFDSPSGSDDRLGGLAFDADGNFVLAGSSYNPEGNQDEGGWLRKYNEDQVLLWAQPFEDGDPHHTYEVACDFEGNVIAVGTAFSAADSWDGWVRKYDPEGVLLWARVVASPGGAADTISSVAARVDGSVFVGGEQGDDAWVRSYSPGGVEMWSHAYDSPVTDAGLFTDGVFAVAVSSDGSSVAAGTEVKEDGLPGAWIRKFAEDGDVLWTLSPFSDMAATSTISMAVAVDSTDSVIVGGQFASDAVMQGWVQKYTP